MSAEKKCGCKGIRACLLCEKLKDVLAIPPENGKKRYIYNYCPECNLCWPDDEASALFGNNPLYLDKLKVIPEFCTKEEESLLVTSIDRIPWMPSQSGRRKQDFGPKVNFKKKKVKIGEFKGFPKFTENLVKKLKKISELSDFKVVELCHLEYCPERGASIDPHADDSWLWGERLVTINLNSSTVLTLTPCSEDACECHHTADDSFQPSAVVSRRNTKNESCVHDRRSLERSFINLAVNSVPDCKSSSNCYSERPECSRHDSDPSFVPKTDTMCNVFRMSDANSKVCVRIVLPPRSLFILAGCARYNWFHEIQRQDVTSRRLAMTFRELSAEFLEGGKECQRGNDLLLVANKFYDL